MEKDTSFFGVLDILKCIWGISEATVTENTGLCVAVNKASDWKPDDSWSDPSDPSTECP